MLRPARESERLPTPESAIWRQGSTQLYEESLCIQGGGGEFNEGRVKLILEVLLRKRSNNYRSDSGRARNREGTARGQR